MLEEEKKGEKDMALLKRYSANEAEKIIGVSRNLFPLLRKVGLLKGSRIGKYWKYDEEELNNFVRMIRGYDLESEESIRFFAPYILAGEESRKKAA